MRNSYGQKGVTITPGVLNQGEKAKLIYDGILKKSGADNVFLRMGYGDNWEGMKDLTMHRSGDTFEAEFPINADKPIHVAFRDSAFNWDNNSGTNYTFDVR